MAKRTRRRGKFKKGKPFPAGGPPTPRDPHTPSFGSLVLMLLPRFYGHAFNNHKDIPFACFFVWSMFLMARLFRDAAPRWRDFLACGALIGLALTIRPGGLPILAAYFVAGLALPIAAGTASGRQKFTAAAHRRFLLKSAGLFSTAWAVMGLPWPWAHENVLLNP